jgi:hypothetical protein
MDGNIEDKLLGLYQKAKENKSARMETTIVAIFIEEQRMVMVYINLEAVQFTKESLKIM